MAQTWTNTDVADVIRKISTRATTDREFRELVLARPHDAIRMVSGVEVPPGFTVKVIENAPGVDQTYVLPDFRGAELSEHELEKVAGGIGYNKCAAEACAADI